MEAGTWKTILLLTVVLPACIHGCGKADVVFVVDKSHSVGYDNWVRQVAFINDVISELPIGKKLTRIGSVSFGSRAIVDFHLNSYYTKSSIQEAFGNIFYTASYTNTSGGLNTAAESSFTTQHGDRPGVMDLCVLVTDGEPNTDVRKTPSAVRGLERMGVHLLVVVIGDRVDVRKLGLRKSDPRLIISKDFEGLPSVASMLIKLICDESEKTEVTQPPVLKSSTQEMLASTEDVPEGRPGHGIPSKNPAVVTTPAPPVSPTAGHQTTTRAETSETSDTTTPSKTSTEESTTRVAAAAGSSSDAVTSPASGVTSLAPGVMSSSPGPVTSEEMTPLTDNLTSSTSSSSSSSSSTSSSSSSSSSISPSTSAKDTSTHTDPTTCPVIVHIAHARTVTSQRAGRVEVRIVCEEGWLYPDHTDTRVTSPHRYWEDADKARQEGCHPVTCPAPPAAAHSAVWWRTSSYGSMVTYTCHAGFAFPGGLAGVRAACGSDGTWAPPAPPACHAIHCPDIQTNLTATVNTSDTGTGTVARVQCMPGYAGSDVITTCDLNGTWTPPVPDCFPVDLYVEAVHAQWSPTEAEGGRAVGGSMLAVLLVLLTGLFVLDVFYCCRSDPQ